MPSARRNTPAENPPISRLALAAMASNTGCTSDGELAMTFNISAVAACCSRASFRSCLGPEAERRLTRVAVGAIRRLVLVVLRPFAGLALRAFGSLVLPPLLDGRVISAPKVQEEHLTGLNQRSGRGGLGGSHVASYGDRPVARSGQRCSRARRWRRRR